MLPSLQNQPGGTGSNPPLSANLPHPTSLINSGQMGIWPYPTLGPSPPAPSLKHWKIQIYQNIGLKPRKYYSIPQRHLSYCLRWSLLLGCCDTVRFTGNRLTPSIPKRQGTINTSLFLILLPSTFGLFYSTFVLYPPIIAVVEYNQHISFFSRQPLRDRKPP